MDSDAIAVDHGFVPEQVMHVVYTNWRGETSDRVVIPQRVWFGCTEWHPQKQWLLDVFDLDRRAERSLAMSEIREMKPAGTSAMSSVPR